MHHNIASLFLHIHRKSKEQLLANKGVGAMELPAAGCMLLHLSGVIPQPNYPSVYPVLCEQACGAATRDLSV